MILPRPACLCLFVWRNWRSHQVDWLQLCHFALHSPFFSLFSWICRFIGPQSHHWLCLSLTNSLLLFSKLYWCDVWLVKMPTQNLLRLLLLLMLMMRNVLTTVLCSFGSWSLVIKLNFVQTLSTRFGQEFEVEVQAKLLKLKFGQYFAAEAWWGYEVKVWSKDIEFGIWSRFV